ncbi:MAG: hypothetical protein ACLGGV_07765 [Bacteroidia bacterium]
MHKLLANILLIFSFSLLSFSVLSQEEEKNRIVLSTDKKGITDETGKKLSGIQVVIKKNGTVIETLTTTTSGKIPEVELPMGYVYEFLFSKPGYVNSTIQVDVKKGYFPDDFKAHESTGGIVRNFDFDMTMYKAVPNVDYSIISSKPRAKAGFTKGDVDWDQYYIDSRKNEIEGFLDRIEEQLKKIEEEFQNLIKQGDAAVASGNYGGALEFYKKAQQMRPDDPVVKARIEAVNQKIKEKEEEERKQKEFEKVIAEGDALLAQDKLDEAIAKYKAAQTILPLSKVPAQKIAEVEKRRKELELIALKKKYDGLIQEADKLFADTKLEESRAKYQEASTLFSTETYPKQQIIKIDQLIAEKKRKEAEFAKLVSEGDQAFTIQQFDGAIAKYQQALTIFDKQEVRDKITKVEEAKRRKEELERKEKQYTELMASAEKAVVAKQYDNAISLFQQASNLFSDRPLPKERINFVQQLKQKEEEERKRKELYNQLVDKANKQFDAKEYAQARDNYNEALKLFPGDAYAKKRYDEAVQKLREIEEEKRRLAELEKKYNDFIAQGDNFKNTEKYNEAIASYTQALSIKPNDAVANQKITEVKKLIEQKEAERQKRVEYATLVTEATRLFNTTDYQNSIIKYKEALALYPNENYPKDQIKIAEQKLREKQEEERRLAEEKKKKEDYQNFITQADDRFNAKSYEEAISFYRKAQAIFPNNPYAGEKIKEAERQLRLIAEEESRKKTQQEREAEFKRLIEQGDQFVTQQEFEKAKSSFNKALALNDTPEVRKKIQEVDKLIAEYNAKKQKEAEEKALNEQYSKLIAEADKAFETGNYNGAKLTYQKALTYKPNEAYPKNKIKEIDDYLQRELENKNKEFSEQQKRQQFQTLIKSGDEAVKAKNYSGGINYYKEAQKLYPSDATVQPKIDEAQRLWDADKANLASSEETKMKREQYNNAIALADRAFAEGIYDRAISKYQEAQTILPSEKYPQQQMDLINKKKQELANQNNTNEAQVKYNEYISKANSERDNENYIEAISFYNQALSVKPNDAYATTEIQRINKKLGEGAKNKQYNDIITKADGYFGQKSYDLAISQYEQALSFKPGDSYANQKIREIKAIQQAEKDKQNQQVVTTQQQTQTTQQTTVTTNKEGGLINIEGYKQVNMTEEEILAAMEKSVDDNSYTRPQIIENTDNENTSRQYRQSTNQTESTTKLSQEYGDLNPAIPQNEWEEKQRIVTSNQYKSTEEYQTKELENTLIDENRRELMLSEHERISNDNVKKETDITSKADVKRDDLDKQYNTKQTERAQDELVKDFRRESFIAEVQANDQKNTETQSEKAQQDIAQSVVLKESYELVETKRMSENKDADDSRILNNERLEDFNQQQIEQNKKLSDKSTALSLANTQAFDDIQTRIAEEAIENDQPREQTINEYEKYEDQRTFLLNDFSEKNVAKSLDHQKEMDNNVTKTQESFLNKDENRLNANSELQLYNEQALQTSTDIQNKQNVSTQENYKFFDEAKTEQAYKDEKADERRDRVVEDSKNVEQKNTEVTNNQSSFAQNKTQTINEQLEENTSKKSQDAEKGIVSQENNSSSINQYTEQNVKTSSQQTDQSVSRTQTTNEKLEEDASKSPTYVSDQLTDNLALKYPEGVTEQTFTQESNGVVTGYVIVRIVVKGNKGDEYKKTVTTSQKITRYFKNGVPITEDIWDKETQGTKAE